MARTVVALYDEMDEVQAAISDLLNSGFDREQISMLAQDPEEAYADYGKERTPLDDAMEGVLAGGALGGLTGLVAGLLALAVPGIGPLIAAGPIASALVGAGVGALSGGLLAALVDAGVEEEAANYYAEGIRRGAIFLGVSTMDDRADEAEAILKKHNPLDLEERIPVWQEQGWKGYGSP